MSFDLESWAAPRRAAVESDLYAHFGDAWPAAFAQPLLYPLETPGKRIRPLLCIAAFEAVATGSALPSPRPAAVALEMVHTYSLVHDDLPAMDDAELRRGRPTVHRAFDEATAVLVGDALLTEAFSVLATADYPPATTVELVRLLAEASGHRGMVGGQAADIGVGGRVEELEALTRLHRGKTGALLLAAVEMGAVVAGANPATRERLRAYGAAVGLAFQLADDLLDADEDAGDHGPPSFVRLLGLEETRRRADLLAREAVSAARSAVGDRADALEAIAAFTVQRSV
jgi:geranylgeranyl pyrophosphate synthase